MAKFTRVNAVITVLICGLLLSLAIPLIGAQLEQSRRSHCSYNLAKLGCGLEGYYQSNGNLPPAGRWTTDGIDVDDIYDPNLVGWPNITAIPLDKDLETHMKTGWC